MVSLVKYALCAMQAVSKSDDIVTAFRQGVVEIRAVVAGDNAYVIMTHVHLESSNASHEFSRCCQH